MKRRLEGRALKVQKKVKSMDGHGVTSDLNSDVWSHVVEYLQFEEVIMLSLVNQSIHQIISDHIRIIHPYCLNDEWSIARALMNHRSVTITKHTIKRIQHIVNQLIEKNEPITKFTKTFIVHGYRLEFDQVLKLLSTPTRQSNSNTVITTHNNLSIVSGLEKLEIQCYMSTSELLKLLSQCHNLTQLVIDNHIECHYDGIDDSISYPVLNSLKSIRFVSCLSDDYNETMVALRILQLAPNLEYFEFRYFKKPLGKAFLESLAKTCPKLKGVHLQTVSVMVENISKDDDLFKFLQNEPHLEYIYMERCVRISGSIYSKMGQFKQLKYFNVEKSQSRVHGHVVAQCDEEPFKGDGVLPHLKYLNIGCEMKGVNVDHLLKMAPNVKNVGKTLYNSSSNKKRPSTSNYLDIVDKLANRINIIPPIDLNDEMGGIFTQKWLEKTTILKSFTLYPQHVSYIDFSKLEPIPSVKKLELQLLFSNSDLLKELFRVFPCVEVYQNYCTIHENVKKTFIELIREGKWPNLRLMNQMSCIFKDELITIRPDLMWKMKINQRIRACPNSTEMFDNRIFLL